MKGLRDEGQIARAILNTRNKQITPENPTIKKFRRKCCSKKKTSDAGVRKRMSCSSVELKNVKAFRAKNRTVKSDENPSHTCQHEYQLNSRLLPQPLLSSPAGQSMCRLCRLPLNHASSSKHFLLTTEGTQEIPDPYEFKPKLRPLKHRLIAEAPTLSYIPHFRQRVGKLLRP
ncbi:Hypothetical predicted protein [Cloeon dipterum]|uniref:Uncharacterized protein n=1 Tax=Cloeon dipterum TaxID=197152 RepID=A0A8S1D384_9INSE|nr:Hypothetical predicted protein [Cloeon dipterum]